MEKYVPDVGDVCQVECNFNLFEGLDETAYETSKFHYNTFTAVKGQIVTVVSRRLEFPDDARGSDVIGFYSLLFPDGRIGCRDFNLPEYYTEGMLSSRKNGPWFKRIR